MSVLYVALPLALLLGGGALLSCLWCIGRGQFDDLDTPPVRVLLDDDVPAGTSVKRTAARAADSEAAGPG